MRPIRLELEGFTSYRQRTELDFSGLDLFVITGPTGAGKSSLVDAITYALYGRVPRVGAEIKDCIAQGIERMQVAFEFAVGDERYRVFRSTSRRGQAAIQLERYEDGAWVALEGRVREANARMEQLIGLDFEAFTRSVLLPQGQFHQFLAGKPEERRKILTELLRLDVYDRIRSRASHIASESLSLADSIDRRLQEDYAEATPKTLRARQREAKELSTTLAALDTQHDALMTGRRVASQLADARGRLDELRQQHEEAHARYEEARELLEKGEQELSDLQERLEAVDEAIGKNAYDDQLYARLTRALSLGQDIAGLDQRLDEAAREDKAQCSRINDIEVDLQRTQAELAAAGKEMTEAQEALEGARREHAAAALRQGLKPGDPCPVCRQPVGEILPEEHPPLLQAETRVKQAKRREEAVRKQATGGEKTLALARQALENLEQRRTRDRQDRAMKAQTLDELLGEEADRIVASLEARLQHQAFARQELRNLREQRNGLDGNLRGKEKALRQAEQERAALAQGREAAAEAIDGAEEEIRQHIESLMSQARAQNWSDVLDALRNDSDPLPALARRLATCEDQRDETRERLAVLRDTIKQLKDDIKKRRELGQEVTDLRRKEAVARELADLLRANHFQAFVQEEALRILAEDSTRQLHDLSGGRYALTVDRQDFLVVDHWNADETRPVKTLSGGETFLASLALALALAERLPELGVGKSRVTLESLFLDEGFGTLDEETREAVAQAVELLRTSNRMVCLITHIRELAERMPARIEVVKSESGSQLVLAC